MTDLNLSSIRNTAFIGHGSSGKTSLIEAIFYKLGITTRLGKVEDGNTICDYLPEEISRQISIFAKLMSLEHKHLSLNLIDTPGYADFIGEVISVLNVVDSVLFVVCGVSGVEVQTELLAEYVDKKKLPKVVFINKLNRENADFYKVLQEVEALFDKPVIPLNLPIGNEAELAGYYDLLTEELVIEDKGKPTVFFDEALAEKYKNALIEAVVETDEELLTKYLEEELLGLEEIKQALRVAIKKGEIIPVIGGAATSAIGIQPLINLITDYLPEPQQQVEEELSAFVFKTMADPYVGKMSYVRVFKGELNSDSQIYNFEKCKHEKIGQILKMQGKKQKAIAKLVSGDIGVIPKLSLTSTGDFIISTNCATRLQVSLLEYPEPYFELAVEPKSKGDEEKLSVSLAKIIEEDPTLRLLKRTETKETIIKGMGEIHLETAIERLSKKFGVEVLRKTPRIPYRETIKKSVKIEGKHKKQTGGHGQYGHVWLEIEPFEDGEFLFAEKIFGGSVPKQYIPAVEKGLLEAMQEGSLAGYPVTKIKATLFDGSYHNVDSSELAFKMAAIQAFRKGCLQAQPILLEPISNLIVTVPEQYMGEIISDLNTKRGKILGLEPTEKWQVVKALVPLEELQNYSIDLKSLTQGRASYKLKFSHYEEVPPRKAEELIKKSKETK